MLKDKLSYFMIAPKERIGKQSTNQNTKNMSILQMPGFPVQGHQLKFPQPVPSIQFLPDKL